MSDERNRRDNDRALAREALERSTEDLDPRVDALLEAVPHMLEQAALRREARARRGALTASIPLARTAIPRLAAAAALLLAVTSVLLLTGTGGQPADETPSVDEIIIAGSNGMTADQFLESMLQSEE